MESSAEVCAIVAEDLLCEAVVWEQRDLGCELCLCEGFWAIRRFFRACCDRSSAVVFALILGRFYRHAIPRFIADAAAIRARLFQLWELWELGVRWGLEAVLSLPRPPGALHCEVERVRARVKIGCMVGEG